MLAFGDGHLGQSGPIIMARGRRAAGWEVGQGLAGIVSNESDTSRSRAVFKFHSKPIWWSQRHLAPVARGSRQARGESWGGEATAGPLCDVERVNSSRLDSQRHSPVRGHSESQSDPSGETPCLASAVPSEEASPRPERRGFDSLNPPWTDGQSAKRRTDRPNVGRARADAAVGPGVASHSSDGRPGPEGQGLIYSPQSSAA